MTKAAPTRTAKPAAKKAKAAVKTAVKTAVKSTAKVAGKSTAKKSLFPVLDDIKVQGKRVIVRMDLNVPMQGGKVTDATRIVRLLPTLTDLIKRDAKVIILSHFDRPGGKFVPSMSLAPLVDALSEVLGGKEVRFGVDCIGPAARDAVSKLKAGDVLLLENLRFHAEEEANDKHFARELAALGDFYVNDAFSCSHRAHASVVGINPHLPSVAGRLMQAEVETLSQIFSTPQRPLAAVVGGSKVSSKLELLENLLQKMDYILIGGAMANTFLYAQGHEVGKSLYEKDLVATAQRILSKAKKHGCTIVLPEDMVVAKSLNPAAKSKVVGVDKMPKDSMALDIGPETVMNFAAVLKSCKTVVWNGPMGAFETSPFDVGTVSLARVVAGLTHAKKLRSVAGGGDTVAALSHGGLFDAFSYLSTAGGAFLEWMEGKELPGVTSLLKSA